MELYITDGLGGKSGGSAEFFRDVVVKNLGPPGRRPPFCWVSISESDLGPPITDSYYISGLTL
jgi:hypothetical protein